MEDDDDEVAGSVQVLSPGPAQPEPPRLTTPFLTRFELARVIGARAVQISHGASVEVETAGLHTTDPLVVALEELRAGKINLVLRRRLPNGAHEDVRVVDLMLDPAAMDVRP